MKRGRGIVWAGLVVCLLLAGGVVVGSLAVGAQSDTATAPVTNESAWPSFGLGPDGNRALSNGTGPVETGVVQWNYTTGGIVHSSPAVVNGTLYVGSDDNKVYAFDTQTSSEQWNFTTGGSVLSSPAVANGTAYVGSYDNRIYALNATDGTEQWNYTTGGDVWSSPAVVNGTVYVGSDDDTVYGLDAQTGSEQWNYTTGGEVRSSPAVVNGTVYVGSYDGEVYALNATDGTEQWSYSRGGPGTELSSPAVVNGTVYIGGVGGSVYALNATDGTERWKTATTFDVQSSPTVWNDTVYIGSNEDVYALDTTTGTEQWSYPTNNKVYSTPTVVNGTVYVGSYDNNVYTLDAVKGTEQWTYTTGGFVFSSPTVVDGIAYFGSEDGNLYALHADDSVPILSEYTVSNPSNQNIAVRFNSDKLLTNLSASISGTESATLSTSDFTPTVDTDGNVTYEAIYTAGSEGSYTATLDTAADGAGNDAATSQAESVVLDAPPTISAYAVSNPSGQNVTVRFNATEQLSTISVSISNAESATLSSTDFTETAITGGNYTYDASYTGISDGTYTATLDTAADAAGNDGATGQQDSVIVDTTPPTAAAGENQTVDEDTTVQFNGSNTTDNTGIASYNWSFGDGMNATGQTVTHTYTDSGEYTVTLTVEDAAGNQDIDTSTVTVESSSNGGSGGNGGGGGSSRSTDTGSTVTVVPAQEPESSDSDDSSTRGSEAADSIDSQSVAVRGVSRGERVSVDFTTPDEDRTATDQDESTGDSDGSDEPTPRQVRNIVPDGLDIQFAEAGDYEFTVRTRDADTSDSAESEPSRTGDSGSAFRSDFSTNSLSDDGVRFARETRQRPVGFIEVDTEFETEAVETATHRFRVRKSYLESTDASVESVRLYRDEIAQWRELDTQQVRETEDYYFFEAETPGFSVFVIGTSAPVFETTDQQLIGFDESTGGVEATVSVENIGSKAGTYDAVLSADGETIGTAEASVDAAERADVTVTGTVETDDPVTLRLAGQSLGDVTRTKPTPVPTDPEQSGLRLVGVLLGVAVVVIGGLLWSRRKNGEETQ